MFESNTKALTHEMTTLAKDAQSLFQTAATLSGEKAEEVRGHGLRLLDTMLAKTQEVQACTLAASKEMAISANGYVKENPWRTMAAVAGAGLVLGLVFGRK